LLRFCSPDGRARLPSLAFAGGEFREYHLAVDGAKVQVSGTQVVYDAALGPNGDHAVVTVDGTEAAVLNALEGSLTR